MGSVKRTHQLIRVIGKIWYIATNNITTRLGKLAAQHRVIHAPFSIRHFPFSRISNGVWHMPDIYPLRNDHKHKFLDLESRINARRANLYKLSFREQLDAPNAFFYSRSSKGRLVSLSVMADDVSRSRDPSFKHLSSPIQFFIYNDRDTHSCFNAIQLTTSSSLSQNLDRPNLFTTRVTNNRYSTIPTLYIYSRPTPAALAYLSPRLFVRIPIYRNAYELCTVHRNVIFTTDPSIFGQWIQNFEAARESLS